MVTAGCRPSANRSRRAALERDVGRKRRDRQRAGQPAVTHASAESGAKSLRERASCPTRPAHKYSTNSAQGGRAAPQPFAGWACRGRVSSLPAARYENGERNGEGELD